MYEILQKMNFGPRWVNWIKCIFESTKILVLINGATTEEFLPKRGLRQGDPLSPLLFNLVGEALSHLLVEGVRLNIFRGIVIPDSTQVISHLQFADDIILFINDDQSSICGVKRILQCFQLLSGMKINFAKSQLIGPHVPDAVLSRKAEILGCMLGATPFKYLGAMIGASPSSVAFWNPLVDKVRRKIENYDASNISIAGRLVLLKAAIDSVPVYWFSLFKMPQTVISIIDKLRRRFFWGEDQASQKKIHLLNWNSICQRKIDGGLGLASLRARNHAFLAKWIWRAFSERDSFWNKFLVSRYGRAWNFDLGSIQTQKCSPLVRGIASVSSLPLDNIPFARNQYAWKLGSGSIVLFWEDVWITVNPLCMMFPELYDLTLDKHVTVSSMLNTWFSHNNATRLWRSPLTSLMHDQYLQISALISSVLLNNSPDIPIWKPVEGPYTTATGYHYFTQRNYTVPSFEMKRLWQLIWSIKVPPRIATFLWKVSRKILPTRSFLRSRIDGLDTVCPWCSAHEETLDHLFRACPLANEVWTFIGSWWGWNHIFSRISSFCLYSILNVQRQKFIAKVWHLVVAASLWTIWLVRNELIFNASRPSIANIKKLILVRVSKWGLASKLMTWGDDPMWRVNPVGTLHIHQNLVSDNFWKFKKEFYGAICAVDAAWLPCSWSSCKAGIGGTIKLKSGRLIYCFSSPVSAYSPLEAEILAIIHALKFINDWQPSNHQVLICSDSIGAINAIYKGLDFSFPLLKPSFDLNHVLHRYACIQYVPSILNDDADRLAKDGLNRPGMQQYCGADLY